MKYLFNNIGIIGLGLIGGSLARAIKENHLAEKITGYSKTKESSNKALEIGMIDIIAPGIEDIGRNCDLIIICTPLSSYNHIINIINKYHTNAIITDVGSLKSPITECFKNNLNKKQLQYVVPAHPIAGTENKGVDSGFAHLFKNKKTILTPLEITNKDAIEKVTNLWQECGSNIEIISADMHDKIYAQISHLPQFIAYIFASILKKHIKENIKKYNFKPEFWQFTRLCASDPYIWVDIFDLNLTNIKLSYNKFLSNLRIAQTDNVTIYDLINSIAESLIKSSKKEEYYSGSGYASLTQNIIRGSHRLHFSEDILDIFKQEADFLLKLLTNNNKEEALNFLHNITNWYIEFKEAK